MKLTTKAIESAQPRDKLWKLFDGGGLFLAVLPTGGKSWRLAYRFGGKQQTIALGRFPQTSLKQARIKAADCRDQLERGINPRATRQSEKDAQVAQVEAVKAEKSEEHRKMTETVTFAAKRWMEKRSKNWTTAYEIRVDGRLKRNVLNFIGEKPLDEVTKDDLRPLVDSLDRAGKLDTAYRVSDYLKAIFEDAVEDGYIPANPARTLRKGLSPKKVKHRAHFQTPAKLADFLRACDSYQGSPMTMAALQLSPIVMLRPGEVRKGLWSEIEWESKLWRKTTGTMKKRRIHLVPLPDQAVEILRELQAITGEGERIFPGERDPRRPMSENTVRVAMRRMGFTNEDITPHGLRGTAKTLLSEMGYPDEVTEAQLAHLDQNKTRAAYNHAEYLDQRREMMQAWADYLDRLKAGDKVTPIGRKKAG